MKKSPRIAIDVSWLGPTGIGRVASEVLSRGPSDWNIIEIRHGRRNAAPLTPFDLAREIGRANADLFWSPGFMPPVRFGKTPVVLTVHDLTHLHYYNLHHRIYYNLLVKPLLKRTSRIVTVSDFSRAELLTWSGVNSDKVVQIYNGVSEDFSSVGPKVDIGRPYILYVGNRRSYKNVIGLMKAFAISGLADKGFVLALSGASDEECLRAESELGLGGLIHYFGFIPETSLSSVYRGAHALALVSLYEGFGLPILEAMACGVPVVTSNLSSMPEVSGMFAVLVDPHCIEEISLGLNEVTLNSELRARLSEAGMQHARKFTWASTARQYWDLFNQLLPDPRL